MNRFRGYGADRERERDRERQREKERDKRMRNFDPRRPEERSKGNYFF